jgi:1-acyl-sn-glycerol-3-phosphate acyltransferase
MIIWTLVKIPFRILFFFLFSKYFLIFFSIYAVLSYFAVKYIMKNTLKYRQTKPEDEETHKKYKMFRRLDDIHWEEKKLLVGAILFSWIKLSGVIFSVLFCYVGMKIVLWGKTIEEIRKSNDQAMRKKIEIIGKLSGKIFRISLGIIVYDKTVDYDYTEYLGPGYEKDESKVKIASYICNHTSWVDIILMVERICPGFISKKAVESYPFIGYVATCIGCIFVDRNDKTNRGNSLNQVVDKQRNIYSGEDTSKLLIFPEGTTTNTTSIIQFKKGAFVTKLPIKPIVIKFDPINKLSLAMDVVEMLFHLFIILCQPIHTIEIIQLPVFVPNEYLFRNYPGKVSNEDWEVYADALRNVMCKVSGLEKGEGTYEMKNEYLDFFRKPK